MNTILTIHAGLAEVLGGVLIGTSVALLMLLNGRIAGISGILGGLLFDRHAGEWIWRALFLSGLMLGAALLWVVLPPVAVTAELNWPVVMAAGLLVGFGTRLGNGCTSGHGICGLARFSLRSLVATLTFMSFGFLTVFVLRHVLPLS